MGVRGRTLQLVLGVTVLLMATGCGASQDEINLSGTTTQGEEGPPGPSFNAPVGWYTDRSGTLPRGSEDLPIAWLSNHEFAQPHFKNLYEELAELPPDGIAIQAILWATEDYPATPSANFPLGELPLDLDDFEIVRNWEAPVRDMPQYRILLNIDGRSLEAQVYFGRPEPTEDQYAAAAQALQTLNLDP